VAELIAEQLLPVDDDLAPEPVDKPVDESVRKT
jgi:hypothetical protein